jgi:hypothetical protein
VYYTLEVYDDEAARARWPYLVTQAECPPGSHRAVVRVAEEGTTWLACGDCGEAIWDW